MNVKQTEIEKKLFRGNFTHSLGYEKHIYADSAFPIIFHCDRVYRQKFDNEENVLMHWHENIEILYVIEGKAKVFSGEKIEVCEENEIAVINSGVFHKVESAGDKTMYYCLIVDRDFLKTQGIDVESNLFLTKIKDKEMAEYINCFAQSFLNPTKLYKNKCLSLAALICIKLFEQYRENLVKITYHEDAATAITRSVMKYINENFNDKINIDDMAQKLGVSKFHMCRSFKKCTNCSIVEFLNIYRVERTKKLIALKAVNVSEAAIQCGFSNMSYFTRVFKRITGIMPSEYKKKIAENDAAKDIDYLSKI